MRAVSMERWPQYYSESRREGRLDSGDDECRVCFRKFDHERRKAGGRDPGGIRSREELLKSGHHYLSRIVLPGPILIFKSMQSVVPLSFLSHHLSRE